MIPRLPTDAINRALETGDWDRASALMTEHDRAVREALAASPSDSGRGEWLALLDAQRDLLQQLKSAREEAGSALQRLRQGNRGAAAYQQATRG